MQIQTLVNVKYQVVIPKEARKKIKIKPGQRMNVDVMGEKVILSPAHTQKKLNWPGDHIRELKGLWKPNEIDDYLEEERNSWE